MGFKVSFTDRAGKPASLTFGSKGAADTYARSVKGSVVPTDADAPVVEAAACPEGSLDLQKAATNAYFRAVKTPEVVVVVSPAREPVAEEAMAEHFFESRVVGMSPSDTWADWDALNGR